MCKQDCELQHGYPFKTAEFWYEVICSKFEFGSETCQSFGYAFILGFIVTSYGVRQFLEEVEVGLLESGYTQRIIAECFDVSKCCCQAMEMLPGDGRVY